MKLSFRLVVSLLAVSLPWLPQLRAQTSGAVKDKTDHTHLVGHEDELLLRRIEDALSEWDPRNLTSPYLKEIQTKHGKRYALVRPDLAEFISDPNAAVVLGKALFWDMQAGSDYGTKGEDKQDADVKFGTACASCHYRFGADARNKNTDAIAYQAWLEFVKDRGIPIPHESNPPEEKPPFTQRAVPYTPNNVITAARYRILAVDPTRLTAPPAPGMLQHEIVGSQGIWLRRFAGMNGDGIETFGPIGIDPKFRRRADMFLFNNQRTRQVTQRNSPSIFNAVFNDRQFHDGRAESTFNGFSVFGDFDTRVVLKKAVLNDQGIAERYEPVKVAIVNASLASQAVGPIVNDVEMSYLGRNFHDLAVKLLPSQALVDQIVSDTDSELQPYTRGAGVKGLYKPEDKSLITYRELVKRAFRKEWWAEDVRISIQGSLTDRLAAARTRVAALNASLPASEPTAAYKAAVNDALNASPTPIFPADAVVTALQNVATPTGGVPPLVLALQNAVQDWQDIEGEILPLRMDSVVDRTSVDAALSAKSAGAPDGLTARDDLMVNNFGLYWGLSIMLYESTLISNDSPFDQMLRGDATGVEAVFNGAMGQTMGDVISLGDNNSAKPPEPPLSNTADDTIRKAQLDKLPSRNAPPVLTGTAMFQRGLRVFTQNCAECHEPPSFTTAGEIEIDPEPPDPIAKQHSHSLVRAALADAFKARLMEQGHPPPAGVNETNRHLLGSRRWFFDQERIPEIQDSVAKLLIEFMEVPDRRPVSFNRLAPGPGLPAPNRDPMITWVGTRPHLEFEPSPQPGEQPLDPYAFYDVGFYNIGVAEPRYDWGVWNFAGGDDALTSEVAIQALRQANAISDAVKDKLLKQAPMAKATTSGDFNSAVMNSLGITAQGVQAALNRIDALAAIPSSHARDLNGIPSLGSAYRLPRRDRRITQAPPLGLQSRALELMREESSVQPPTRIPADHSAERNYLNLDPLTAGGPRGERAGIHFFKRARRMVMTEESWGHRKPFITDNELMGWGAFKTPTLRNVALTEPYMHNGRFLKLRQVIQFYSFDNTRLIPAHQIFNPDLHPEIGRLPLNSDGLVTGLPVDTPAWKIKLMQIQDAEALLFFMHCLTDDRVRLEKAPFDHPSIIVPNGFVDGNPAIDNVFTVDAVGSAGGPQLPQFPSSQ